MIKDMDIEDRPREKLQRLGLKALSDYELLAIMLGSGIKGESVITLSKNLIDTYGLNNLFNMDLLQLSSIKGIKLAKASKLICCFELARRCLKNSDGSIIDSHLKLFNEVYNDFLLQSNEKIMTIYVDCKCKIIKKRFIENDNSSFVELPLREIIKYALLTNCYGIFIIHNHPSGDIRPSKADVLATKKLYDSLIDINVHLLDHLIICNDKYFSFDKNNLLNY